MFKVCGFSGETRLVREDCHLEIVSEGPHSLRQGEVISTRSTFCNLSSQYQIKNFQTFHSLPNRLGIVCWMHAAIWPCLCYAAHCNLLREEAAICKAETPSSKHLLLLYTHTLRCYAGSCCLMITTKLIYSHLFLNCLDSGGYLRMPPNSPEINFRIVLLIIPRHDYIPVHGRLSKANWKVQQLFCMQFGILSFIQDIKVSSSKSSPQLN